MTALGNAPSHWRRTTIGEIADVRLGRQRSPKNHTGDQMQPYLRAANVDWYGLRTDDVQTMNFTVEEMETYALRQGDILVVEGSGSATEVGKCALVPDEFIGHAFQNTLIRVRPGPAVDPRWLMYRINADAELGGFLALARGSGIFHLGSTRTAKWPVAVPPLHEQGATVATLERMFSHSHAAATALRRVDRRTDLLRQATLASATGGGWRAREGSPSRAWPRIPLDQMLQPLHDGRLLHQGWSPRCDVEPAAAGEWGILKTTAVQPGHFDGTHNKRLPASLSARPDLEVRAGDILMTSAGPRSRCGVATLVPATRERLMFSGKIYRFRANPAVVLPAFLEAFLLSPQGLDQIEDMKTGISDSGLNLTRSRFLGLQVPVPPLADQRRLMEQLAGDLPRLVRLRTGVATVWARQASLRRSILKSAFEGRLARAESPSLIDALEEAIA